MFRTCVVGVPKIRRYLEKRIHFYGLTPVNFFSLKSLKIFYISPKKLSDQPRNHVSQKKKVCFDICSYECTEIEIDHLPIENSVPKGKQ